MTYYCSRESNDNDSIIILLFLIVDLFIEMTLITMVCRRRPLRPLPSSPKIYVKVKVFVSLIIFNYIRFFFHFYIKYMSLWSYWICLWLMNNHNHCYQSWCFWMCLCPTCMWCFFFSQRAKLIKQFPYQQEKWLILIGIFNFFFSISLNITPFFRWSSVH